jgi:hypothetical protein
MIISMPLSVIPRRKVTWVFGGHQKYISRVALISSPIPLNSPSQFTSTRTTCPSSLMRGRIVSECASDNSILFANYPNLPFSKVDEACFCLNLLGCSQGVLLFDANDVAIPSSHRD